MGLKATRITSKNIVSLTKIQESTWVNLPNSWPESWDRDNFKESKHKK
jgi:hypothetical protein